MAKVMQITNLLVFETYQDLLDMPGPSGLAWVIDATGDSTVENGSALYFWDAVQSKWVKKYETEMMDRPVNRIYNIESLKKITEYDGNLYFAGVRIARISDIEGVVTVIATPIINSAVGEVVGPVAVDAVEDAMAEVISDINTALSNMESQLREEYQQADSSLLGTANANIASAKSDVLRSVINSAGNSNSITSSVDASKKLTMSLKRDSNQLNRLSVSSAGVMVSPELPTDATNGDLAMFNGTSWIRKNPSELPSTLQWATI
jgi:hypothetical protein